MLLYTVTITDSHGASGKYEGVGPRADRGQTLGHYVRRSHKGLTLAKARAMCERAARRGVKLYGGAVTRDNWGAMGGAAFAKRVAVIRLAVSA